MNEYTRAPHRRGGTPEEHSPNAALLIDFDNVTMGIRSNLGAELRKLLDSDIIYGKVAVQRAYADWRRYPQYIVPLSESSIDLIFAPAYGSSKKNATDIRLAIDALELVFTRPEIGTFILLSGDSDFSSLVLKLKEYGKYVIGVGLQESSSDILVQNCDEYYSYNTLSGLTAAADTTQVRLDPWELAAKAVERMASRGDVMRSDRMKQVMLEFDPSFDEKSAGFSKFNRFLAEAANREIVLLRKAPNGQYEVVPGRAPAASEPAATAELVAATPHATPAPAIRAAPPARRKRGRPAAEPEVAEPEVAEPEIAAQPQARSDAEVGEMHADDLRRAYQALASAVAALSKGGAAVRDSEVKRKLIAADGGFDEGALGFRKFSRFLIQARDEGIIDLVQGEDGNYYLSEVEEPSTGTPRRKKRERRGGRAEGRKLEVSAEPEEPAKPAEEKKRRGRRGRRSEDKESVSEVAGPEARTKPDRQRPGRKTEKEAKPAASRSTEAPKDAPPAQPLEAAPEMPLPEPETTPAADAGAASRARGGMGRFRRGSRGRGTPEVAKQGKDAEKPRIGLVGEETPVEGDPAQPAKGRVQEAAPSTDAPTGGQAAGEPARQGMGRFRKGSRGGGGAPAGGGSEAAPTGRGETAGRPDEPPFPPADGNGGSGAGSRAAAAEGADAIIHHMVRTYSGVGKRTAERLVEEFGASVFDVIDANPERLSAVLSERRAQAVVAARQAERSAGLE